MTRTNITVIVRVLLYVIAGVLMRGGWLPGDATIVFTDPAVVELVAGAVLAVLTGVFTVKHEGRKP
ncbi:hypothetical protein Q0601_00930 [Paracoccus onubensis]|uniref:hypothetical protein n=1 Tax=Paracoccus onubensis TaxID=1675788 RepID=UPI0027308619|nr:hypothetical protein [Paracoccus onubensis]MDP0925726.1 hypothetical protein [Paracoccus onubensis]